MPTSMELQAPRGAWARRLAGPVLAALTGLLPLRGQTPAKVVFINKAKVAFTVSLGDAGSGSVKVSLLGLGTVLGTLASPSDSVAVPSDKSCEFTLVADTTGAAPSRDLKIVELGKNPGWGWFRLSQPGKNKPLNVKRAGFVSSAITYESDTSMKATITATPSTARPETVLQRLALVNATKGELYFAFTDVNAILGTIELMPPNEDANNTSNGTLKPKSGARQINVPARSAKPEWSYSILIADSPEWRNIKGMAHIERFTASYAPGHPFRIEPAPFQTKSKNFTKLKFVLDESDPEFPVLRAEEK